MTSGTMKWHERLSKAMKLPLPVDEPSPGAKGSSLTDHTDTDLGNPYPWTIKKNLGRGSPNGLSTMCSKSGRMAKPRNTGTLRISPGHYNSKSDASGRTLEEGSLGSNFHSSLRVLTPGKRSAAFKTAPRTAPDGARYVKPETGMLQTPTCQYAPPSSLQAEGCCVSISKLKRFGTKHFPDAKIQNGFRTGLISEEQSLPDRSYNIETGHQKGIGNAALDNRANTSYAFRSRSSRVDDTRPPTSLAPGEYYRHMTFEDHNSMSFARTSSGAPQGSPQFVSNAPRLAINKQLGGFPRPMLSLESEESRNGWAGNKGRTVSDSDRWKGGIFDECIGKEGPEIIKNGKKNFVEMVESSPIRYSEMQAKTGRTIGRPAFQTKDGMRSGCNASTKPPTSAEIGPGYYSLHQPKSGSPDPSAAFASTIPRFFVNLHPKSGENTIGRSRKEEVDSQYKLEWDVKHWKRRPVTVSNYVAPSVLEKNSYTPGPGFYHNSIEHWEDEKSPL